MPTTRAVQSARSTGTGRRVVEEHDVRFGDGGTGRLSSAIVAAVATQIDHADFTDGGGAAGTKVLDITIPKGAILLGSKVTVEEGFAGDTTAVVTIGDGSDVDRYMTGTPSVLNAAADGIQTGVPSGNKLLTADNAPTVTVTGGADWGSITAGKLTVTIYYIPG